jgi:hypothetical protein
VGVNALSKAGENETVSKRAGAVIAILVLLSAYGVGVTNAFAATPTLTVDPADKEVSAAPRVETVPAFAPAGGSRALLGGRVDARNSATDYWFEFGATVAYGTAVPAGHESTGSGGETFVIQEVTGLLPATVYHYRLVAESAAGLREGEDMALETAPASTAVQQNCPNATLRAENHSEDLPACRAYEMVSPPDKNGNAIGGGPEFPLEVAGPSSSDPAIAYESFGALPGSATSTTRNFYLGRRGPDGWTYDPLSPVGRTTVSAGSFPTYRLFLPDLSYGFLDDPYTNPSLAPGDVVGGRNLYVRNNVTNTYRTLTIGGPVNSAFVVGASDDASHVVFESTIRLTPEAPAEGQPSVYEWVDGHVRLASILPDGTAAPSARGGGTVGGVNGGQLKNAVSHDGSRVFFGVARGREEIYVRINGQRTVKVSGTQRSEPGAEDASDTEFQGATEDGSSVFFTASGPLTDDAVPGESLYRFDVDTEVLTDLSAPINSAGELHGISVLGISEDGSYAYFYASGELLENRPSTGIYLWHSRHLSLVAGNVDPGISAPLGTARVTPDGRHLVFLTTDRASAFDNNGNSEAYTFDAGTGRLTCVSCRPDGQRPAAGGAQLGGSPVEMLWNPPRSISDDGTRVFFDTGEALAPGDVNHQLDTYVWEGGSVHLISSGTDSGPSYFSGASATGDDAYFITSDPLVAADRDEANDLYDARVDGGFPAAKEAARCTGEGCQGPEASRPPAVELGSEMVAAASKLKASMGRQKLKRAIKTCRHRHHGRARKKCIAKANMRLGKSSSGGTDDRP